jgi:HK97 gp10 family phage protein
MEFTIRYAAPYAAFVEFGTRYMAPRAYLRKSWAIVRGKARAIAKATLERMIREAK